MMQDVRVKLKVGLSRKN